jgi:hypothetical protein
MILHHGRCTFFEDHLILPMDASPPEDSIMQPSALLVLLEHTSSFSTRSNN